MANLDNIFERVGKARVVNSWQPSIPWGKHRLALVKYGGKTSAKDRSVFLEAEFVALNSDNPDVKPNMLYSWPWFINKPDEFGYTHARARNFIDVVQQCIGSELDATAFGNEMATDFSSPEPRLYGLLIDAHVEHVRSADGSPRLNRKGQPIFNVVWRAIPQSLEEIVANRAKFTPCAVVASPAATAAAMAPAKPRTGALPLLLKR